MHSIFNGGTAKMRVRILAAVRPVDKQSPWPAKEHACLHKLSTGQLTWPITHIVPIKPLWQLAPDLKV